MGFGYLAERVDALPSIASRDLVQARRRRRAMVKGRERHSSITLRVWPTPMDNLVSKRRHPWRLAVVAVVSVWPQLAAAQATTSFPDAPPEEPPYTPPARRQAPPPSYVQPPAPAPTYRQPTTPAPTYRQPTAPPTTYPQQPAQPPTYYQPRPAYPQPVVPAPGGYPATSEYGRPAATGAFRPPVLPYREGAEIPEGYELETSRNNGLMVGGSIVFGVGYVVAFGIAASKGFDRANGMLAVPVIGPWISLTRRESPCDIEDVEVKEDAQKCVNSALDEAALIAVIAIDGLVQGVGTGLFIGGAASSRQQLVRKDVARIHVAPQRMGRSGYGLGVVGVF